MKILSIKRTHLALLLVSVSPLYSMEGYKKVQTMQVPNAVTLATNADHIAVGTALGPVKLYDSAGTFKEEISHYGDGGIVLTHDNKLIQVGLKGSVFTKHICYPKIQKSFDIKKLAYCIAEKIINCFLDLMMLPCMHGILLKKK